MNNYYTRIYLVLIGLLAVHSANATKLNDYLENINKQDQSTILHKKSIANFSKEQSLVIDYLNNIKTMVADFIQISPDGTSSEGKFFLSRPGKLRWQYNPPVPIQIIINGDNLIYYDYELNEATYTEVDQIMGAFLTSGKISFNDEKITIDKEARFGLIKLVINKSSDGKHDKRQNFKKMIMIFNQQPLELKKFEFIDNDDQLTSVSFHNSKFNMAIDNSLFTFKNPKIMKSNN